MELLIALLTVLQLNIHTGNVNHKGGIAYQKKDLIHIPDPACNVIVTPIPVK